MTQLMASLDQLSQTQSVWIYLIIFFGKVLEVSTSTLRNVLINRGIRMVGSIIAILEITLWVIITGTVLNGISSDPLKIVVYAIAFGLGNFLGSWLDELLAFGLSSIQIIVPDAKEACVLACALRGQGFGITVVNAHGMDDEDRFMLLLMIRRKRLRQVLSYIAESNKQAVVTVSDVKVQKGGYFQNSGTRLGSLFK